MKELCANAWAAQGEHEIELLYPVVALGPDRMWYHFCSNTCVRDWSYHMEHSTLGRCKDDH